MVNSNIFRAKKSSCILPSVITTLMCIPVVVASSWPLWTGDTPYTSGVQKIIYPLLSGIAPQRAFYWVFIFPFSGVETLQGFHRKLCTFNGGSLGDTRSSTFFVGWLYLSLHYFGFYIYFLYLFWVPRSFAYFAYSICQWHASFGHLSRMVWCQDSRGASVSHIVT